MREVLGSQWSFRRIGFMWEKRGTQETRRAAAFWTRWSFNITFRGRPKRRELQQSNLDVTKAWIRRWAEFWSRYLRIFPIFLYNNYIGGFTKGINILRQGKRWIHNNSKIASHIGWLNYWLPHLNADLWEIKRIFQWKRSSIFESFKDSLFWRAQILTSLKQLSILWTAEERSTAWNVKYSCMSSAYAIHEILCADTISWRGVVNIMKSNGPATEPCGTPHHKLCFSELTELMETDWERPNK